MDVDFAPYDNGDVQRLHRTCRWASWLALLGSMNFQVPLGRKYTYSERSNLVGYFREQCELHSP